MVLQPLARDFWPHFALLFFLAVLVRFWFFCRGTEAGRPRPSQQTDRMK
jgi:hypothetical protein